MPTKVNSNSTGLRFAEESTPKVLIGSPVWYPLEPNGYNDTGATISSVARRPINPDRQMRKGTLTDKDVAVGYGADFTSDTAIHRLLQGMLFADARQKLSTQSLNGTQQTFSNVDGTGDQYTATGGLTDLVAGDLVFASLFGVSANNGLKTVSASSATTFDTVESVEDEASPPATAKVEHVGFEFGTGEVDIDVSGSLPRLSRVSGSKDLTDFGLIPGEWVYVGGDAAGSAFVGSNNNGFCRVSEVAATYIEFDKTSSTMTAEVGAALNIRLFFGNVIRNEPSASDIVERTYQIESSLGEDDNGAQASYFTGAMASEWSLQFNQADKLVNDFTFSALDSEYVTGLDSVKSGTRPDFENVVSYNTSNSFQRLSLHVIEDGNANPDELVSFLTELTVTVNNNVTPNKALAVFGGFSHTVGVFGVSASLTGYFSDQSAIQAIEANSSVSIDLALANDNVGFVLDLPLLTLADGRPNIEIDQAITLPLTGDAVRGTGDINHTLLLNFFPYLPNLAEA